ncbi:hypothetical protein KY346_04810 [Candidatus Woesearchaeota archaeon]|nr:hypothetical protein [Candidatus Woesearchaeota archaeon]
MRYLPLLLILLTACAPAVLLEKDILTRYGSPDEVITVDEVKRDLPTGFQFNRAYIYHLPISIDKDHPDKRVIFLVGNTVTGIAVFKKDGSVTLEPFPDESMTILLHHKRMNKDFLTI